MERAVKPRRISIAARKKRVWRNCQPRRENRIADESDFSFEKLALRDAVRSAEGARIFAESLDEFLHGAGKPKQKFERWLEAVGRLPKKQSRVLTHPIVTVFGFIAQPKKHIFLKPKVILPNGAKYKFTYNKFGEIEQIHYPTGGFEEIEYEPVASLAEMPAPYQQTNRGVKTRKVYESVNDADPDIWTYMAKASANNYRTSTIAPDRTTQTDRFMHRGIQEPPCTQPKSTKGLRWGYDNPLSGMAYEERSFSSSGQLIQRTLTKWTATQTTVALASDPYTTTKAQRNARILTTETILYEGDPGLSAAAKLTYDTDADTLGSPLNVKKTTQYAFKMTSGGSSYSRATATQAPPDAVQVIDDPTGNMTAVKSVETTGKKLKHRAFQF